jgi:hypothetical protein
MLTMLKEQAAQVHHAGAVQRQCIDRGAAGRRETDDQGEVVALGEVLLPAVAAGMVEGHELPTHRVRSRDLVVLVVVAAPGAHSTGVDAAWS